MWWCWEWFLPTSRLGTSMRGHSALGSERRSPAVASNQPVRLEDRCGFRLCRGEAAGCFAEIAIQASTTTGVEKNRFE